MESSRRRVGQAHLGAVVVIVTLVVANMHWGWFSSAAIAEGHKPRGVRVLPKREAEGSFERFERQALETQTAPRRTPQRSTEAGRRMK
ncbi:MAG: hypothetical protein HY270_23335 [Deltaproteobacteria bacterium]|nr:hypothetical protein [Deltaproteobacteria bacterium]